MLINITNPQAIEDWLRDMSAGDDAIAQWLKKAFTKALKKREESAAPLREWPKNPPEWMKADGTYHEFQPDAELTQKVSHIKDWLRAGQQQEPQFVQNLYPMDLDSAFNKANKYFEKENQRNRTVIEDDTDTKTIMRFDNGMRIARLMSLDALKYEGSQMGHCVGSGGYDEAFTSGRKVFYSLRDAQNEPHATMEVVVEGNILRQCKGKSNKPPVEKYMPMLQKFLSEQKFKLEESATHCGLVQDADGQYYTLNNLPDNIAINGSLDFSHRAEPLRLPKGLFVSCGLDLAWCTSLTELPENLTVGYQLVLTECTALTHLPKNLSARGCIFLDKCPSLTHLSEKLFVGRSLFIDSCPALTSLPEDITVGQTLHLSGCTALTHLPDNLSVGNHLYLERCKALKQLPENLSVGGELRLEGCKKITSIPRSLECKGKIYTDIGTFSSVAAAANAFDRKYRPQQQRTSFPSRIPA